MRVLGTIGVLGMLLAAPGSVAEASSRGAGPQAAAPDSTLEARLEVLREAWDVPGMAVTVVRGDSVLMARGFGVRRAGDGEPVDEQTLFAIGSTTKAFTSALMATLVGEGRLGWDDPVVDHLPWFRLDDPWVTREITLRDVLAHRSGLPMANFMWLPGGADRVELVRRLRHLEPVAGFRSAFTYQNVLYAAAGLVVEEVTGRPWADALEGRLLRPLGMDGTHARVAGVDTLRNVARPHAPVDGRPVPVPFRLIDPVGPAGSMLSNARDMAPWLLFQLGAAGFGESADVSGLRPAALDETHTPQIPMAPGGTLAALYPGTGSVSYGMGWTVSSYRGRVLLDHGGGIDGMTALVGLLREEGIGVSILTNQQLPVPPYWILYTVLDHLLGRDGPDWSTRYREMLAGAAAPSAPERVADAAPAGDPADYAGVYRHPALGSLTVDRHGGSLRARLGSSPGMRATLEPWHFETFRGTWTDAAWASAAGPAWVTFRRGSDGVVDSLVLEPLPGESWTFERAGDAQPSPARSDDASRP